MADPGATCSHAFDRGCKKSLDHPLLTVRGVMGMGLTTARVLAERGITDQMLGRSTERLAAAAAAIDGEVESILANLYDPGTVAGMIASIEQEPRHVAHLVNAAGTLNPKPFIEHTEVDYDNYLALNKATSFITQAVVRNMMQNGGVFTGRN